MEIMMMRSVFIYYFCRRQDLKMNGVQKGTFDDRCFCTMYVTALKQYSSVRRSRRHADGLPRFLACQYSKQR